MIATIDRTTARGSRDAALILLGFASALRHARISTLVEHYIRPLEAMQVTSNRDLGL